MPRVVVIPTARPTFAVDVAQKRVDAARALLTRLGAQVEGPTTLVMTPDDVEGAAAYLSSGADLVINVCASFSDANPALTLYRDLGQPVLLWSFREPGPVGDRLWLNSMCGANLYGHALVGAGGQVRLVYGDPDEPQVEESLRKALTGDLPAAPQLPTERRSRGDQQEAQQALDSLRGRQIGIIGDAPPGFTPSEFNADILDKLFGLTVDPLTVEEIFDRVRSVPAQTQDRESVEAKGRQPSLGLLDDQVVTRHAAVTSALRDWSAKAALAAVSVRCWPEFPTEMGVCPCSSLSRLADDGIPTQCERDVYGAVTMLLLEALGSGTTYLVDTVELVADRNVVRLWHCGSAATELAADPSRATQALHCNRKIGVAGDFALRPGRVVMARLTEDVSEDRGVGLRLLIASGESLPAVNRFQGNTAEVLLDADATTFVHGLVTGGFPHHTVLAWTDVRPQLRTAADILGIPVVEW